MSDGREARETRPSLDAPASEPGVPSVPGYELGRELGRGGQAVVYEARSERHGRVALKVLLGRSAPAEAAFRAECRVVERISHDAIVPVLELVTARDGRLACALELVEGRTLGELLERGEVPSSRALAIGARAARALAAAHAAGVVHRDVKPANLFIETEGRVRLLDFGVARDLRDPLANDNGEVVGTPRYFAAEQARGLATTPATDVWALGVVLWELLTGRAPFSGASKLQDLLYAIAFREPRPPRSLNPAIDPRVEAVLLRCLEKDPAARFATGRELALALEPLVEQGVERALAPVRLEAPAPLPEPPPAPPPEPRPSLAGALSRRFVWELRSSPERLWPLVSNTEKFNRAAGLPPVRFSEEPDGRGGTRRIGRARVLGRDLEWVEHPYEWVAPERQSVLRVYRKGPVAAAASRVTLEPRSGGGTTLVHEVQIDARGVAGRLLAAIELARLKKRFDAVYRRIDDAVASVPAGESVALEGAQGPLARRTALARGGDERLARGIARLRAADTAWGSVLPRLEQEIREAPDPDAERLRPCALARRWGVGRRLAVALLCQATVEGLLEAEWHLLCPLCRVPVGAGGWLEALAARSHCPACQITFDNDIARSVELAWRPAAAVRPIPRATYCLGGPGNFPHVVFQQELEPGETRAVKVALEPGAYRLHARGSSPPWELVAVASGEGEASHARIEAGTLLPGPERVTAGVHFLTIENASGARKLVRLERAFGRDEALTALEACGLREVRALGPRAESEAVRVAMTAFVVTGPEIREPLARIAGELRGAVLERDEAVAAFADPADALDAALRLHEGRARIAVHAGPAVAFARGGGVDFQGPTLDLATRLLAACQGGELAATPVVLGHPGASDLVGTREFRVRPTRGLEGRIPVVFLGGAEKC